MSDASLGLLDCANWSVTQTITTTTAWPSGVYLIRVDAQRHRRRHARAARRPRRRPPRRGALRRPDDAPTRRTTTTAASRSTTTTRPATTTVSGSGRAVKVSFDRPYEQQHDDIAHDWYTRTDYADGRVARALGLRRLLQRGLGPRAPGRRASRPPRLHLRRARRVLLGGDAHGARAGARHRHRPVLHRLQRGVLEGPLRAERRRRPPGPRAGRLQERPRAAARTRAGSPTGTWRDPAGANQPENALTGVMYVGQKDYDVLPDEGHGRAGPGPRSGATPASTPRPPARPRRSAPACSAGSGTRASTTAPSPPASTTLAASPGTGDILQDAGGVYAPGSAMSHMVKYTAAERRARRHDRHEPLGVGPGRRRPRRRRARPPDPAGDHQHPHGHGRGARDAGEQHRARRPDRAAARHAAHARRRARPTSTPPRSSARSSRARWTRRRSPPTSVAARATRRLGRRRRGRLRRDHVRDHRSRPASRSTSTRPTRCGSRATIKAANGVALGTPQSWSFTTRPPDTTPPAVAVDEPGRRLDRDRERHADGERHRRRRRRRSEVQGRRQRRRHRGHRRARTRCRGTSRR